MRTLLAVAAAAFFVLAGCTKADDTVQVTCPTSHAHAAGDDHDDMAEHPIPSGCPVPVLAPIVTLSGAPAMLTAYHYGMFNWSLDNRTTAHAHSMLTEVHISSTSVPQAELAGPESYGTLVEDAKRQHQDHPKRFQGIVSVAEPGTYYLRAYAEYQGKHLWSDELTIMVHPVTATGEVHTLEHTAGGPTGEFGPDLTAALGDEFQIKNSDQIEHTFHIGAPINQDVTVPAGGTSATFLLFMPNAYSVSTVELVDQIPNKTVTINVPDQPKPTVTDG